MAELYPVDNDYPDPFKIPPANRIDNPGARTLYLSSTGFEKALADTDAERLMDMYAEAIIDEWNPWQVAYEHLPFLAWAQGVNLWESWWDETFKRNWTARQWYLKSIRGKRAGLDEFVTAVGGHVKRCIVPPARAYGTRAMTDAERAAYVARFPQLRVYPYVARSLLPWLCYNGKHYDGTGLHRVWNKNGSFLGPRRRVYPTVQTAGGKYTRTAVLYEPRTGVETKLTIRRIVKIRTGEDAGWGFTPGVSQYDESVILPLEKRPAYFCSEHRKYLGVNIYLGKELPLRTISLSRSGPLELVQAKAQYQTVFPKEELLQVRPEMVGIRHPRRKTELYAARREYLVKAKNIVTHEIASNLEIGSPSFGRALFGMHANPFNRGRPTFGTPVLTPISLGNLDPAAYAWSVNVQAIGGSVSPGRLNLINNFILGLRTDNIWNRFDRIWLLAAENQQSARVDIKVGITPAVAVSAPQFTADRGYTFNGFNYLNTNFTPASQGVSYTLNSAHIALWNVTSRGAATTVGVGTFDGANLADVLPYTDVWGPPGVGFRINTGIVSFALPSPGSQGLVVAQRTNASTQQAFFNGVSLGAAAQASSALVNYPFFVGARDDGGAASTGAADQYAVVSFGSALTGTEALAYYTRLRTLLTAIGVP